MENRRSQLFVVAIMLNRNITLYSELVKCDADIKRYLIDRHIRKHLKYCNTNFNLGILAKIINGDCRLTRKHLRMNHSTFKKVLEIIPSKRSGYQKEIELIVFLFWLACGTSYRVLSVAMNIPKTTSVRICHKYLDIFQPLLQKIIHLPTLSELSEIGNGFATRATSDAFSKAVGALDGTHVKIKCPVAHHDEYINRKLDYSIPVQAVCDHQKKCIDLCIGFPGSVHDQRVLRNSNIYKLAKYPPAGYFLLGDSGYQCTTNPIAIMTPYKRNHINDAQIRYNHLHSKARIAIEQAFGMLKTRWRSIFLRSLELSMERNCKVIGACCILHNVCLSMGDVLYNEIALEEDEEANIVANITESAVQQRDIICASI